MPDLTFAVKDAQAGTGTQAVILIVEIANGALREIIESVSLRCQIQIETPRRRYSAEEQIRLLDLFGEPERWGQTLHPLLWANIAASVGGFSGETSVALTVPCPTDLRVAATRYFHSLEGGAVPITLLFSGTVFYQTADGRVQIAPIPWDREARFTFPVDVWKQTMTRAIEVAV